MNGCVVPLWMYSLLPWCYLGCRVAEVRSSPHLVGLVRGRVCARPSVRVSCRVAAVCRLRVCVPAGRGHSQQPAGPGQLWILFLVFLFALSSEAGNRVNSSVCTVWPPPCVLLLSLCRSGGFAQLRLHTASAEALWGSWTHGAPSFCHFSGSHERCARESKPGDARCSVVRMAASCSAEYSRAAVDFSSFCHASLEHFC